MNGLLSHTFCGFGPNPYDPVSPARLHQVAGRLRRQVRECCPRCPGVYGMLDEHGDLIYVGKAKKLRTRLLGYFRARNSRDKARRILARTSAIVWEHAPSEFAALLRELQLIRTWRPRLNVQYMPRGRQLWYVCLGRPPAPYAYVAKEPTRATLASFGPVPAGWLAREAARRLNDVFRLRDCPKKQTMIFADQTELFVIPHDAGCMRLELGACVGPCAAACSRLEYGRQVRAARRFLEGEDDSVLVSLKQQMESAAKAEQFEKAAVLRNTLEPLDWLRRRLEFLRAAQHRLSFIYASPSHTGGAIWYVIQNGWVASAVPAPREEPAARAALQAIEAAFRLPTPKDRYRANPDQLLLVASWFKKYAKELKRTLPPADALRRCEALLRRAECA